MEWLILIGILLVVGLLMAGCGAYVAGQKRRDPIEGALFGFFLGPLGIVIVALLPTGDFGSGPARRSTSSHRDDDFDGPRLQGIDDSAALRYLGAMEPPRPKPAQPWQVIPVGDPEREQDREREAIANLFGEGVIASAPKSHRWDGDTVHWTCECGKARRADRRYSGQIAPCPACRARTIVPAC